MTHWKCRTYANQRHLLAPAALLEELPNGKVVCPTCGMIRPHASLLIDVSDLPIGGDWACDGCWSNWERMEVDVGSVIFDESILYEAQGAPPEFVQKVRGIKDAARIKYGKRILNAHLPRTPVAQV